MAPEFPIGPDGRCLYPKRTAAELRANKLQKAYGGGCHMSHAQILETFRAEIRGEPCIEEREAWEEEFFGPAMQSVYTRQRTQNRGG
ncbi:hypothetical protein [Cupriavidus basilensis]|uniref:hypothetical protein n=1 Tax=Cupriavidus basilensis TaxID=68895 RepID=UPI0011870A4C|nr:hypothetical protein [Cupriavidus basilensis]